MFRLASLGLLVFVWFVGSALAGEQMLPAPMAVLAAIAAEARSGELFFQLGVTLERVLGAFALAMTIGSAIGLLMGRVQVVDRLGTPDSSCSLICRPWWSSCWPISGAA